MRAMKLRPNILRRQRSDGSLIDISISSAPLRAVDGRITGIMSVMDDVTERKKAKQQELAAARAELMREGRGARAPRRDE